MADRYWSPAANANWGDANVWATTEGGDPTGIATPTSADDVYFTSTNVNNCAVAATANCLGLSFNSGTGKYTGTFSGSSALNVYGDLLLSSTMNRTYTGAITFLPANATTKTVTSDTKTLASNITLNAGGATGTFQLADVFVTTGTCTLTNGVFDSNNLAFTSGDFTIGSGCDGVTFGISTITCNNFTNSAAFNPSGNHIIVATGNFSGNGRTYYAVELNGTSHTVSGNNTFTTLTRTGTATTTDTLTITADSIQTVGTFKVVGNSVLNRLLVQSSTFGTQYTINATTVSTDMDYCEFEDCIGGVGSWDMSGFIGTIGDGGGNTNLTCSTPQNCFWVHGATANTSWSGVTGGNCWFTTSGGAIQTRVPLVQDTAIFDANSFAADGKTVTLDSFRIGSMTFADTDQTFTLSHTSTKIFYGSVTLDSNMTLNGGDTGTYQFKGRGTDSIDCAGKTLGKGIMVNKRTGTLKLTGNFAIINTATATITSGTFTAIDGASNYIISAGAISVGTSGTLTMGSATHLLNGTGTVFTGTGTISASTGTLKITNTTNTANTFAAGTSKTYNNIWFSRGASTATNTITATTAVTFADIKDDGTVHHHIVFPNITVNCTSFTMNGSSGNLIELTRTGAAGAWSPTDTAGTNTVTFCTISNSTAAGGATWLAPTSSGNVDGGGNTGWDFTAIATGDGVSIGIPL